MYKNHIPTNSDGIDLERYIFDYSIIQDSTDTIFKGGITVSIPGTLLCNKKKWPYERKDDLKIFRYFAFSYLSMLIKNNTINKNITFELNNDFLIKNQLDVSKINNSNVFIID
jgi:hypothetical protein